MPEVENPDLFLASMARGDPPDKLQGLKGVGGMEERDM